MKCSWLLFLFSAISVQACNWNEFVNSSSLCQVCPTPCNACTSKDICIDCQNGYYLQNGKCLQCQWPCLSCFSKQGCKQCIKEVYYWNWWGWNGWGWSYSWYWMDSGYFRYWYYTSQNGSTYYNYVYFVKDHSRTSYAYQYSNPKYYYYFSYQDMPFNTTFYKGTNSHCIDVKTFIFKRFYGDQSNPKQKSQEQTALILSIVLGVSSLALIVLGICYKFAKLRRTEILIEFQKEERAAIAEAIQ